MVTALIFLILLIAILTAWFGNRSLAITLYVISFVFAIGWFIHHVTASLGLVL